MTGVQHPTDAPTIFVSIGNTDNRLTQQRWAAFYTDVDAHIRRLTDGSPPYVVIHGRWVSPSTDPYQNACWAFSRNRDDSDVVGDLRFMLSLYAKRYGQDSIMWAEAQPEFLPPTHPGLQR